MAARERFQFSIASMMMIVAVYALVFGALRSLRVSIPAFVMVALYFTTVIYGQWALFAGRNPYSAAFLVGGTLFVVGSILNLLAAFAGVENVAPPVVTQLLAFPVGGFAGIGVAAMVDLGLLLVELVNPPQRDRSEPQAL
jgi:hypothetical protein